MKRERFTFRACAWTGKKIAANLISLQVWYSAVSPQPGHCPVSSVPQLQVFRLSWANKPALPGTVVIHVLYILSTWGESTVIVPDFAIYVYGSSCHHHFFCLILAPFSSFYLIASARQAGLGCQEIYCARKEERMRRKKNKLHVRVVVKSWTIRLASVLPTIETCF